MLKRLVTMVFYSVARGRQSGVYQSWNECENQVKGFSGAVYKKFKTLEEAESFASLNANGYSVEENAPSGSKRPAPSTSATIVAKKPKITTEEFTQNIVKMESYGGHNFLVDNNGFAHVYTDGSCENNGQPNASAGLGVYFGEGHSLNRAEPVNGPPTNNRGEIQAATKAIELSAKQGIKKLCINTDSQYLINAATDWMPKWKSRGWKLLSGGEAKNKDDFRGLDQAMAANKDVEIQWKYVPAHTGILGNERADTLAKEGAQKYKMQK